MTEDSLVDQEITDNDKTMGLLCYLIGVLVPCAANPINGQVPAPVWQSPRIALARQGRRWVFCP